MKRTILSTTVILVSIFMGCNNQNNSNSETTEVDSNVNQTTNDMKSFVSIFEIPAIELSRAIAFYQIILGIKIEKIDMPGMQMGLFPSEGQMTFGVIVTGDDYVPSSSGVTIYLNGGDNLQIILDKVEENGGKIVTPKILHGDESGYFAMFLDTEGNKIGLHSPN